MRARRELKEAAGESAEAWRFRVAPRSLRGRLLRTFAAVALLLDTTGCRRGDSGAPVAEPPSGAEATAAGSIPGGATEPSSADSPFVAAVVDEWTGDLDEMIERRQVRALVAPARTQYWIDRGQQVGIEYELLKAFEDELNRRHRPGGKEPKLQVVFVPTARDQLIPALLEGRGDIAAGILTITAERQAQVDFGAPFARGVKEIVVTGPQSPAVSRLEDLAGQQIFVRRSSSFWSHLAELSARFEREGRPPIELRAAPEELQNDDILEMLNAGLIGITVTDQYAALLWAKVFSSIRPHEGLVVHDGGEIAWMFRKGSPRLKADVDAFARGHGKGSLFGNTIIKRYTGSTRFARPATSPEERKKFERVIELFRTYGERYDLDYLLMAAQGYQESRLDQSVRSRVGAIGVMQIMPATGQELDVGDIRQVEPNIHAGAKYVRFMIDRYFAGERMDDLDKQLFAFASYNAGPARVRKLREEASRRGLDPNRWFNNVELIAAEQVGQEPVSYVSNIFKYSVAYTLLMERYEAQNRARQRATARD
jgi:membrane-bound lytic murein transglycosylase MltF